MRRCVSAVALLLAVAACSGSQPDTARFCEIHTAFDLVAQTDVSQLTPEEFEEVMREGVALVDESAEVAPAELRAEADRAAVGFHAGLEMYEQADFDLTQLDPAAAGAFLDEHAAEMEAAVGAIDDWAKEHC